MIFANSLAASFFSATFSTLHCLLAPAILEQSRSEIATRRKKRDLGRRLKDAYKSDSRELELYM